MAEDTKEGQGGPEPTAPKPPPGKSTAPESDGAQPS